MSKRYSYLLIPLLASTLFGVGLSVCRDLMPTHGIVEPDPHGHGEPDAHSHDLDRCRVMCLLGQDETPGLIQVQVATAPVEPSAKLGVVLSKAEGYSPPALALSGTIQTPPHESRGDVYLLHSCLLI